MGLTGLNSEFPLPPAHRPTGSGRRPGWRQVFNYLCLGALPKPMKRNQKDLRSDTNNTMKP